MYIPNHIYNMTIITNPDSHSATMINISFISIFGSETSFFPGDDPPRSNQGAPWRRRSQSLLAVNNGTHG